MLAMDPSGLYAAKLGLGVTHSAQLAKRAIFVRT